MSEKPVIVVAGPACSGKSTLATTLAEEMSAALFSQDEILTEIIPDSDRNLKDRLHSYDEMYKRAQVAHTAGKPVVLEGTFSRVEHRAGLVRALPDADFIIVELEVPLDVALDRFSKRKEHPAIDLTVDIVEDRQKNYPYSVDVLRVDGTSPIITQLFEVYDVRTGGVFHDIQAWKALGVNRDEPGRTI